MKEFEKITKKISDLILSGDASDEEIDALVAEQDEIIKSMDEDEIEELLQRNIPGPYKAKIQKLRGE